MLDLTARGLYASYEPLEDPVTDVGSIGSTSALLLADHPGNLAHNVRRTRIVNTHATQNLGLCLLAKGADATTGSISHCILILANSMWSGAISANHRLCVIGSGPATTYSYMVSDV
jgi:hypothetical protein